ncbi:MAG: hypothetical protein IT561_18460 [Alphaproteobacteria bacterium]|nr:hypothetical protein [Alphaproteobacteria bacterium]
MTVSAAARATFGALVERAGVIAQTGTSSRRTPTGQGSAKMKPSQPFSRGSPTAAAPSPTPSTEPPATSPVDEPSTPAPGSSLSLRDKSPQGLVDFAVILAAMDLRVKSGRPALPVITTPAASSGDPAETVYPRKPDAAPYDPGPPTG